MSGRHAAHDLVAADVMAKAGLDLVEDEHDPLLRAEVADLLRASPWLGETQP